MISRSDALLYFRELEDLALDEMSYSPQVEHNPPAQAVVAYAQLLAHIFSRPKHEWLWGAIRSSWSEIQARRSQLFVDLWLCRREQMIAEYFESMSPKPPGSRTWLVDRAGRAHAVQTA